VQRLTEQAGFHYAYDEASDSFLHATSLIFATREGRIVRYIGGLEFLPARSDGPHRRHRGRERTVMRRLERLCYAYDPEGRSYVLQVNRIILVGTGILVLAFVGWLVLDRRRAGRRGTP